MGNASCKGGAGGEDRWLLEIEEQRREGKALLHDLVRSDDADWKAIVNQAEILHRRDQKKIAKSERICRRKRALKAQGRCRRYGSSDVVSPRRQVGVFSVNLMTMSRSADEGDRRPGSISRFRSFDDDDDTDSQSENGARSCGYDTALVIHGPHQLEPGAPLEDTVAPTDDECDDDDADDDDDEFDTSPSALTTMMQRRRPPQPVTSYSGELVVSSSSSSTNATNEPVTDSSAEGKHSTPSTVTYEDMETDEASI